MIRPVRGAKHHWWPRGLSKYWADDSGCIHRVSVHGQDIRSKPEQFAMISNGHNMIFNDDEHGIFTVEHIFDRADGYMPDMVRWLERLRSDLIAPNSVAPLTMAGMAFDDHLDIVRECIVSLIVRSPRFREAKQRATEYFRGSLDKRETMGLIAANINQAYCAIVGASRNCGKLVLLISSDAEFIYGDGVYSNISASSQGLSGLRVAIPITPDLAIVWSSPMAYRSEPKIRILNVDAETVQLFNYATQVYSKEFLFYRTQRPDLCPEFKAKKHLRFLPDKDPMADYINELIPDESKKFPRSHVELGHRSKRCNSGIEESGKLESENDRLTLFLKRWFGMDLYGVPSATFYKLARYFKPEMSVTDDTKETRSKFRDKR